MVADIFWLAPFAGNDFSFWHADAGRRCVTAAIFLTLIVCGSLFGEFFLTIFDAPPRIIDRATKAVEGGDLV